MNKKLPKHCNLRVYPNDLRRLHKKKIGNETAGDVVKRLLDKEEE